MTSTIDSPTAEPARHGRNRAGREAEPAAGRPAGPVGVRAGRTARRRQLPLAGLGLLLIVMSMLGFALWSVQQAQRAPVLVAGDDIAAGAVIERRDVVLVPVGAGAGLSLLAAGQEDLVVGRTARGPIPAGTPLSPALVVSASEAVPAGSAVVGATLEAGEYPTSALQAGDRVRLVETAPPGSSSGEEEEDVVAIAEGTVWAVEPLAGSSRQELFVSLVVAEIDAADVSNAASLMRLRLVLIGAGS